jgi:hypothetical protein
MGKPKSFPRQQNSSIRQQEENLQLPHPSRGLV